MTAILTGYDYEMTRLDYEVDDLPGLGWLHITWVGEENIYFTLPDGTLGFVKP